MKTREWLLASFFVIMAVVHVADAQPTARDDEYRLSLRNRPPETPPEGVKLELPDPHLDSDPGTIHALVQLKVEALQHARDDPAAQTLLRGLFDADPGGDEAIVLIRPLQGTTYEAVIRRDAATMLHDRGIDSLDPDLAKLIRWIGSVPSESKLDSLLLKGRYPEWARGPRDTLRLLVTFFEDVTPDAAETALRNAGADKIEQHTNDTWHLLLRVGRISDLADEDGVRLITQGPQPFRPLNDEARNEIGMEGVHLIDANVEPPTYGGLTGDGVTVAVMDLPVDTQHEDFWLHDGEGNRVQSRILYQSGGSPHYLHGTHVAGIAAGNGFQSNRHHAGGQPNGGYPYQWRGMAPGSSILAYGKTDSSNVLQVYHDAYVTRGAAVSNHSYEKQDCYKYESVAETTDRLVHGSAYWPNPTAANAIRFPPRAIVWAAGNNNVTSSFCENSGYFGLTTASKNAIVVGMTKTDDGLLYDISSPGPTYDGRLKPDVVAPGCDSKGIGLNSTVTNDYDATSAQINGYLRDCGTSMAAPVVAGTIAVLVEKWRQRFCPTSKCFPLPSTLKAVLIQGATDRVDTTGNAAEFKNFDTGQPILYYEGPDYATGYGLTNAPASIEIVDGGPGIGRRLVEASISWFSGPDIYEIVVPADASRLRVTLAWDDEPGDALLSDITSKLVNDLDLELISPEPSNTNHLPWVLDPLRPAHDSSGNALPLHTDPLMPGVVGPAKRGVDRLNNVEQVEVERPDSGTWTVRVRGDRLSFASIQSYSLAADYAIGNGVWRPGPPGAYQRPCRELEWAPAGNAMKVAFPDQFSCGVIPMDPLCKYVAVCGQCDGFGRCPEASLNLIGLPEGLRVEIRRRDGGLVTGDEPGSPGRPLVWQPHAREQYGIVFVPVGDGFQGGDREIGVAGRE